jgi:uncharacterized protein (DUF885 family)
VLKPWARNPAFYVSIFPSQSDVPAREGPVAFGAIELWTYQFPLSAEQASNLSTKLNGIPAVLRHARENLTGNARDLWVAGIRSLKDQSRDLASLDSAVTGHAELALAVRRAQDATDEFVLWLEKEAPSKAGPSGVGIADYNWYLANVHLIPFSWQEQVGIMRSELARANASLRLEEERNRALPAQQLVASAEEYTRRFNAAVTEYMKFLADRDVLTIRPYMDSALRARIGTYSPGVPDTLREFFTQADYRDPVVMRTHGYHWFDLARMTREPHESPIRRAPLLYNIFDDRAEGMATAMEEMMMHAGLFDTRPRSRELIWILLAQRAARALGDLRMHANEFTMEEAVNFASLWTPRGWLRKDGSTVWGEQHLYLQQPSYGTSYIIGKIQIEQLIGDLARQQRAQFTLKKFMDAFNAAGIIPVTLIRWELMGDPSEVRRLAELQ